MNNEYDDLLASEGTKDEARTTLRASVLGALPTNPDQYAEAKRLARTTGVPAPVVERNMDEVKKQATLNEYDSLIERAPVTASKFQDPDFAKVAHDERDQLAWMESLIASAPRPEMYGSVLTPTGRGIFSPTAKPQPTATPPALDPAKVRAEMLRRFGFKGASAIDRKIDWVLANETRAQLSPWDGKTQEFGYDDATRKGVAMVKLTWDFLADQLAGSLGMDQTETRRIMADTQQYIQGLGKDFDTELAMDLARKQGGDSVVGVLGALPGAIGATDNPFDVVGKFATEQLVASSGGAAVGSMAAAPLRRSAAAYITNQATARSVGVALTGASASSTAVVLQSLGSNYQEGLSTGLTPDEAGRRAWVKTLAEVPANALAGALVGLKIGPNQITNILAQTGVQAVAGGVGAASASLAVGEKIDPLEIALEIAGEGIGAAPDLVVSGALTPASIVSRKFQMEREAQAAAAKASADHLTRILQAAEASKTRARDPETFAQLVQDAAEASGTAPTEVFIDAQPLVDTLRKAGMTEAQIREALPSVAEQLGDEYTTGGSVAIPIGEAVAAFAGTGAEADLVRFARTTEDGYSVADSEQALAALDEMDADAQRIIAEQQDAEAWLQSAKVVEDTIFAQLDSAGRFSSDVNRTYATLLRNYYVTQADVMGITPEELYRQFPLTASGVAPTGQVLNDSVTQITPEQAMTTNVPVEMPADPLFAEAVGNTPGAEVTENGLLLDLVRFQKPEQEGAQSIRTGVFYLPAKSADVKHYRNAKTGYGGGERFNAPTLVRRPLFVKGATGGAAPEQAYRQIKGKDAFAEMSRAVTQVITRGGNYMRPDPALKLQLIEEFLDQYAPEQAGTASLIERVSREGNTLRYALQELAVAHAVREAGYDAVVGYSKTKAGARISEVFDVREQTFPARGMESDIHDKFLGQSTFDQEVKGTTPYAADTIEVDGKTRPVVNNKGQRIAQTEEGLRNFWRWFGESKVVDAEGRPLVVYHGTPGDDFSVFNEAHGGIYFAEDPAVSEFYAEDATGLRNGAQPFYLKAENLFDATKPGAAEVLEKIEAEYDNGTDYRDPDDGEYMPLSRWVQSGYLFKLGRDVQNEVMESLRAEGFDGVRYMDASPATGDSISVVVFRPEQIKSAIGNQGTFDPADPNILHQSAYTDEELDFLVADGSLSPEQAATLKADAKNRGQNADARTAGADRRAQQGTGTTGRPTGQVYGRTVAGTSPRSGWESATRVRGADGQPRRIFRGSRFGRLTATNFADDQLGLNSTHPSAGLGVWFSTDQSDAASYGEVSEQFLDLRNPKVFGPSELPAFDSIEQSIAFREALRAKGHDGIALDYRSVGGPVQFVAFDPEQVVEPAGELYQSGAGATVSSLTAELEREHPGLKLNLIDGRNAVTLSRIVLPQEQRNAGTGTAIMQRIVEWADANAKVLALTPSSDFGGNKKRLTQFYKRFGFVENKGKSKDFTISEAMVRQPEMNVLNQSAYHGSPYRFSKFSLEHMGKGEGAQAYGWGLYFAGKREVAEYYRQVLSKRQYAYDGQPIPDDGYLWSIADEVLANGYEETLQKYRAMRDRYREKVEAYGGKGPFPAMLEKIEPAITWAESIDPNLLEMTQDAGQLYEVNIPEDGEYLLWDKPLSEQPEKVRTALEKADVMDPSVFSQYTGEQFYEGMVRDGVTFDGMTRSAAQERASKFLNSIGIPGIKYLDGTSRADGDGSYNYVIFDDAAIEIVNTFYQQQNGKTEARGSFNPTTLNIALLEKADLSTFLHETGHFFFEMQATIAARPDAPARIVDDVNTLLKEVGFKGTAAEWLAQPLNARRESHEKVAESFEQYLITGDAPTVELQGLFNQMRAWMLAVYKTLKQFFAVNNRAGMTAEVAGVFDRMLASDAAIAETKRVRAMSPLFKSVEAAGMDAAGWAAYQDDAGQMDADARRDLDARQVRDMKWLRSARSKRLKELQADASAKRREARIEARRRLLQEPVYRAMQFLRGKVEQAPVEKKAKGLDTRRDDLLTAIAKLGGLNKDLVVAEWGIDPKDFAKSPVFGKPILRSGKAGLSPDGMAEALAEVGYLQPKDGDRYSLADFEAMFNDAARGIQHYSLDADYDLIHGYKTLPVAADLGEQPFAAGRLSRSDLEARFANSDVDWQRLGVGRRGMIAEVGMDADAVANIVGFNTGEEMVKALLAAEPLQDATEALTDQIMLERYGDITSPEGLQRAADAALANDAHARILATEYARLNKAVGSPRAVQLAAKEAAERTVDRQPVRLARPEKATAAAARAGKAAEKAHAAGNLDEAAGFKRNQILNTAIARAQRELRTFVDKAQGDFAKMFGKDDHRAKTRDMNLVNLARAALAQYGLAPDAGGMKALQYLELVTQYDPALAENLKSMLAAMPEGKDFRDLTAGEFRTVASLVRGMWEMSRGVKQITIDGKKVEIDAAADELVAAVTANNGGKQGDLPGYSGTTTTADDLRVGALGIKSMLTRVEQWADYMGPAFKRLIWQPVSEAVTRYRVRRNEMVKQYRDLLKTIEPDLTFHKIHAPELGLGGFTFNAGKSEVLHAILHSGNESNLRKLLLGRGWATVDAEGNLDTSRWDAFVRRMAAEGVITRNDMDFVQGVWDLLETVKGDAQKAHRELYGYYFNEVTATPFVDAFGVERRGGYVPALADGLSSPDAMQKREQEELLHAGNSFMFPSTGKGFTQSRVEYNRPLELDLRTIGSHLDKVTRFAYIEPAVRDVGKLLLNKRVSRALNGYDQTIISQMLNPWLQRAARQTVSTPGKNRWSDKFFNGLRSRSGVVIMFANVVNTLQQLTGFSVAAIKVPAPALLRATYRMVTDPKRMSAEAAALSPWLAERMAGQSFEMQQEIKNILVNPNPVVRGNEFLKHNAYFMQQAMQNMMDPIIWWGAYDNAVANGANQRDAIRAGDEAVRTTQGTFAPEDVSAFESNTAFVRLFTQFYGYFNMLANTLGAEAKKAIRDMGYGAATPRLLFIWFAGLALPAVVGEIIARGLPDDEDDEDGDGTLDEWLALFFGSQGRTLAAMAPGIGQGVSLAVNLTDDKVYNDRLSISPGMSMAETTIRGGVNLLQGEVFDERLTKAEVRDTLTLIGMATGAPTGAIARSAGYLVDVENGRADPETPVDYAIGLTTGR